MTGARGHEHLGADRLGEALRECVLSHIQCLLPVADGRCGPAAARHPSPTNTQVQRTPKASEIGSRSVRPFSVREPPLRPPSANSLLTPDPRAIDKDNKR